MLALIIAGVSFIAVLVIVALLLLAIDPAQITKTVDRAVLLDADEDRTMKARMPRHPTTRRSPEPTRPRQSSSTSFDARPVYVAGVSASSRSFAASPMSRPRTNSASSAPPTRRPRVRSFSSA